ncbi:MAG: ATP-binding protein [Elusimicrobia bacterium]|nr:ATP-binding protein [Elusimicrobiota bacterium]
MDSLHVGAYNRFAHAAATQVISSPGTMYNPLFLFGVPGTGKSHLLHALAHALSNETNGVGVFVTTGPRLSRAVNAALAAKNTASIDKLAADAKALLIDDIHLMSVSDLNKNALANVFKSFFDRKLQVVLTSGYPPRALAALEESLKFSFSKGWSVDLKVPGPAAQKDLISAAADRSGTEFGADEIGLLHEKLSQWGYQELSQWLHRFAQLKKQREAAAQPALLADMLPLIYEPVLAGGGSAPQAGAPFQPPPVAVGAVSLAVIVPKDQLGLSTFVAGRFHEVGAKNSMRQSYRHALWESYDAQQPFGAPFMIGDLCERAAVTHVLVLGPSPESALGPRATEFAHAVRHILENLGMEMGWIPFSGATIDANYLNAHLDFIAAPARTA